MTYCISFIKCIVLCCFCVFMFLVKADTAYSIVGGNGATNGEYPWMVFVYIANANDPSKGDFCGGSLVHPQWVLTAKHCTYERNNPNNQLPSRQFTIIAGGVNKPFTSGESIVSVRNIIRHQDSDLALLELERSVPIQPGRMSIITLGDQSITQQFINSNINGVLTGWGRTESELASNSLMKVELPHRSQTFGLSCPTNETICGGRLAQYPLIPAIGGCSGDSGGPFVALTERGGWKQIGVAKEVSLIAPCTDGFTEFVRVATYADWVYQYVPQSTYPGQFNCEHGLVGVFLYDAPGCLGRIGEFVQYSNTTGVLVNFDVSSMTVSEGYTVLAYGTFNGTTHARCVHPGVMYDFAGDYWWDTAITFEDGFDAIVVFADPTCGGEDNNKDGRIDPGPMPTPPSGGPTPMPTPIPSSNIEIININSPSTVNPNQSFIPEVTVRLLNGQQLLESRGDMLRHYSNTNYSTFPHIGVAGSVISGQTYTFRFYNDYPFVAPSANGDYESIWRVWADGQWIGPEIPIRFTVGSQSTPTPDWLLSHAEYCEIPRVQCSLDANISNIAKRAFRIRVNDWTCGEISGGETYLLCRWDAVNFPNGDYTIYYELDSPGSEGTPWTNPLRYTHNFELGGSADGLALCDGGNGVYIHQGDRCVRLTQSNRDIAPLDFSGQNVEFSVTGPYQAWLYNAGDFKGTVWIVTPGSARTLSYVNSVKLIDNPDAPPPLPADPYACDSNTALLFHFDEASGLPVNACPPNGSATSNTAVRTTGKWGNALRYENSASQKTDLGSYDPCALTVDFWYRRLDTGGVHVLARQENKWELSSDGNRVNLEVWGKYGSERAYGWKEINDSNWHYIMFTYNCASSNPLSQLYIDNVLVGEIITNEHWHLNVAPILLDGRNGQHAIHGEIDEFRVSNVVRSITDLGPALIPATPTPIPTDTPVPTSTPTPLPTATPVPTATPYPDSLVLVQSVVATGNSGTQMHSTSYRLVGIAGSVALPANATMLTSANFTHKPGFLAGQTRIITSASQSQQAAYPGDVGNSVEDKRIYLPLISR